MMRVFIKTVKNDKFEIYVKPEDKVSDVKKIIETTQYAYINYPAHEQKLIHHGNVLTDETTFKENNIAEDDSIVIMHSKGCDGISIIELFYMVYISRHVVEPEKQIGTISMKVDDGIQYNLYAEHKIDISKPSIEYMDDIPLVESGPIGPFYSGLELEFDDLFCGAYNGSIEITPKTFGHSDGLLRRSIQSLNCNGDSQEIAGRFLVKVTWNCNEILSSSDDDYDSSYE